MSHPHFELSCHACGWALAVPVAYDATLDRWFNAEAVPAHSCGVPIEMRERFKRDSASSSSLAIENTGSEELVTVNVVCRRVDEEDDEDCALRLANVRSAVETGRCPIDGAELERISNHERDSSYDVNRCPECGWSYVTCEGWPFE